MAVSITLGRRRKSITFLACLGHIVRPNLKKYVLVFRNRLNITPNLCCKRAYIKLIQICTARVLSASIFSMFHKWSFLKHEKLIHS